MKEIIYFLLVFLSYFEKTGILQKCFLPIFVGYWFKRIHVNFNNVTYFEICLFLFYIFYVFYMIKIAEIHIFCAFFLLGYFFINQDDIYPPLDESNVKYYIFMFLIIILNLFDLIKVIMLPLGAAIWLKSVYLNINTASLTEIMFSLFFFVFSVIFYAGMPLIFIGFFILGLSLNVTPL